MDERDDIMKNMKTQSYIVDKEESGSERMGLIDQIDDKLEHYGKLPHHHENLQI